MTVTSRQDVQTALGELILAFQKQHGGAHAPRLLQQNGLPPLKLQVRGWVSGAGAGAVLRVCCVG